MKEIEHMYPAPCKFIWVILLGSLLQTADLRAQTNIWDYLGTWYSATEIANSKAGKTALTLKLNESPYQVPYTGSYVDFIIPEQSNRGLLAFTVRGSDGGSRTNKTLIKPFRTKGGGGAILEGFITIGSGQYEAPPGSTVRFISGKCGEQINSIETEGADGGAGTGLFLQKAGESEWHILMVAGGGGGAYSDCCTSNAEGHSASATTNGKDGGGLLDGGKGGTNGAMGESTGILQDLYSPFAFGGGGINGDKGAIQDGIPTGHSLDLAVRQPNSDYYIPESDLFGCGYGGISTSAGGGGGGYSGGGGGGSSAGGGGGGSYLNTQWINAGKITIAANTNDPQNGYINFYFSQISSIKLAVDVSKCIDDYGAGTSNGNNIQLYHCHDHPAQQWVIRGSNIELGKDFGKCIDLDNGNTSNGANIRLWECTSNNNNQIWIYDVANQLIRSGVAFDKCMDLDHGNTTDGTNIRLWDCNNTTAQKWLVDGMPSMMPTGTNNSIHLAVQTGKCIDIAQSGTANGTNVQLYDCNGTNAQHFTFDGRAIKMQSSPNKCLDLSQSQTGDGANIQLYDCNGTNAQQWIYDGFSKAFRSAVNTNKCIDLSAGSTANGTNIQLWDCQNGNTNQQFVIGQ